jgi:hypothetical protein
MTGFAVYALRAMIQPFVIPAKAGIHASPTTYKQVNKSGG